MAFTKIVGAGIHTLSNVHTHNINSSGIITATQFVGVYSGTDGDFSGNVTIDGNLTVNGTTTTLDTNLTEVDKLEVAANNSTVGAAITQSGTGDILNLYDGSTEVFSVADGGAVTTSGNINVGGNIVVADHIIHQGDTNTQFGFPANDQISFVTGGTERLHLSNSGVGIGTDTPIGGLHLNSNGNNGISFRMENWEGAGTITQDGGEFVYDAVGHIFRNAAGSSERLRITSNGYIKVAGDQGSQDYWGQLYNRSDGFSFHAADGSVQRNFTFYSGASTSTERLRITHDGKLLMGVNSSQQGDANLQVFRAATTSRITFGNINTSASGIAGIDFCPSNKVQGSRIECQAQEDFSTSANRTADLVFFTRHNGTSAEKVRIDSNGYVMIGNSDASAQYSKDLVVGNTTGEHGITIISQSNSIGRLLFSDSTSSGAGTYQGQVNYNHSADELVLSTYTLGQVVMKTSNTERLRITSDGGVGINTDKTRNTKNVSIAGVTRDYTNSGTDLVDSGGIILQPTISLPSTGQSYPGIFWSGNTAALGRARAGILGVAASNHEATDIVFLTKNIGGGHGLYPSDERLRINSSGQLIMTNAATQTFFDFSTTNNSTRGLFSIAGKDSSGNAVTVKIGGFGDTGRGEIFTHSNHDLGFATNNAATQMMLSTNGNLLVGTTSDTQRLHVYNDNGSTGYKTAFFYSNDTANGTRVVIGNSGNTSGRGLGIMVGGNFVGTNKASLGWFNTDNTYVTHSILTLTDTGRIGINDTDPNGRLSVKQSGLADNTYRFSYSYRSGNNATGYTASGINLYGTADNSNGDKHTTYIYFGSRDPSLNGNHGANAWITMSNPDSQGSYGTGQLDFYIRSSSAYAFPNDPQAPSSYWMSSILTLKGSGRTIDTGTKTITGGTNLAHQSFRVRGVWSGSPSIGKEIELISGYDSNVKMAAIGYNLTDTSTGSTYGGDLVFHTQPSYSSPTSPIPERMRISSSGYVTKPAHPSFHARLINHKNADQNPLIFDDVLVNVGSHYKSSGSDAGKFVVPVAGTYFFFWEAIKNNLDGTVTRLYLMKNGSKTYTNMHLRLQENGRYSNGCMNVVMTLAVGDKIHINLDDGGVHASEYTHFGGYLIG